MRTDVFHRVVAVADNVDADFAFTDRYSDWCVIAQIARCRDVMPSVHWRLVLLMRHRLISKSKHSLDPSVKCVFDRAQQRRGPKPPGKDVLVGRPRTKIVAATLSVWRGEQHEMPRDRRLDTGRSTISAKVQANSTAGRRAIS